MSNAQRIWNFLYERLGNAFGVAGLMGNLRAESALKPDNLQTTYEKKLGMTDASYTAAVDNGTYKNFAKDSAGYGLAQWTYKTRKQNLLNYAKEKGVSIGDLDMQLEFLWKELGGYKAVLKALINAKSVREASDAVLTQYEKPSNQGNSVKMARAKYGQEYYDQFAVVPANSQTGEKEEKPMGKDSSDNKKVVVITSKSLNVRIGDSQKYDSVGYAQKDEKYEWVATSSATGWHAIRVNNRIGWVSPNYSKVEAA